MCLTLVITHNHVLTAVAEIDIEGVLQDTSRRPWEVLECCVRWNVHETDCILLPFGAEGKHFGRWVEFKAGY